MKEFVKCITLDVDWIVKKTNGFQSLNKLSLLYWGHIQDLPSNHHPILPRNLESVTLNPLV